MLLSHGADHVRVGHAKGRFPVILALYWFEKAFQTGAIVNQSLKLNLGSGLNKRDGFVNVDKYDYGQPELVMDLEQTPWEFSDDSVGVVVLNHTLEHLGKEVNVFFAIIKEIYRICENGARIEINVPHPRHDNFINDPTHVRIITPELMGLFSKKNCLHWQETKAPNSPLALYLGVDFEFVSGNINVEQKYLDQLHSGQLDKDTLMDMASKYNNIATEYQIVLRVVK